MVAVKAFYKQSKNKVNVPYIWTFRFLFLKATQMRKYKKFIRKLRQQIVYCESKLKNQDKQIQVKIQDKSVDYKGSHKIRIKMLENFKKKPSHWNS